MIDDLDPGAAEDTGGTPWMDAVDPSLITGPSGTCTEDPWWAEDSPLIEELYGTLPDRAP